MPPPIGLYAYLLDNDHLFYRGRVMEDLGRFEAWRHFKAAPPSKWIGGQFISGGEAPGSPPVSRVEFGPGAVAMR